MESDIHAALTTHLRSLALSVPIGTENDDFTPPSSLHGYAYVMPSRGDSGAKNSDAFKDYRGIYQISLFENLKAGVKDILDLAGVLTKAFDHGVQLPHGSLTVEIETSYRNNGRRNGGFYQVDVIIEWLTFAQRT